jgi:hypothetical protein
MFARERDIRDPDAAENLAASLVSLGNQALTVRGDVANEAASARKNLTPGISV